MTISPSCNGLHCMSASLIEAHIVPRGFARDIKQSSSKHNFQISMTNAKPTQHGTFDTHILCADCDNRLGKFDDYGLEISRRFQESHVVETSGKFCMPNVDGDRLALFALAVLWRASISKRPEFSTIRLGPYQGQARDVLFGAKTLAEMPGYELLVSRFTEPEALRLFTSPSRIGGLGINAWGFTAGGFRFAAKFDKRAWPNLPAGPTNPYVVNGKKVLAGFFIEFTASAEGRSLLAMADAQIRRSRMKMAPHKTAR